MGFSATNLHFKAVRFLYTVFRVYQKKLNPFKFKLAHNICSNLTGLIPRQINIRKLEHNSRSLSHIAI